MFCVFQALNYQSMVCSPFLLVVLLQGPAMTLPMIPWKQVLIAVGIMNVVVFSCIFNPALPNRLSWALD